MFINIARVWKYYWCWSFCTYRPSFKMCRISSIFIIYNQWNDCIVNCIGICGIFVTNTKSWLIIYLYILNIWRASCMDCRMELKFKIWRVCCVSFQRIFHLFYVFFSVNRIPTSFMAKLIKFLWNSRSISNCSFVYYFLYNNFK